MHNSGMPAQKHFLIGQTFGRLTVVGRSDRQWDCKCICGNDHRASSNSLVDGCVRSCGCYSTDVKTKHGHYGSPTYNSWQAMIERCGNPKHLAYHRYGGRGIVICQSLRHDFSAFLRVMGERPNRKTLDRKDNDGNYTCGQCEECVAKGWSLNMRWSTYKEQRNNTSNSRLVTIDGVTKNQWDWSVHFGIPYSTLRFWMSRGDTIPEAVQRRRRLLAARLVPSIFHGSRA